MDSGNSGSLQSSSGGDDEFDSRCGGEDDSSPLSALLRQPTSFGGSFYGIQDLAAPPLSQSRWPSTTPLPAGATLPQQSSHGAPAPTSADQTGAAATGPGAQAPAAPPRGSRKRTRASRRAPTTVLTTDTSNFRAMVQEFTGVPAPPFASSAGARSRFDHLFPSRPAAALPPYLLRPFAHKLQHQQQASPAYPPIIAAAPANKASAASATAPSGTAGASGDGYRLASAPSGGVIRMQAHGSGGNFLSFQSPVGAQLDGNNASRFPALHQMFDAASQRVPNPAGFSVNSEPTDLHRPHRDLGHGGDELSGLVAAASSGTGSAASRAAPLLERNAQSTTTTAAAVRAQGVVESSWICTSE